ncbi:Formylglycine-generating enzyme, required for sulfatase activity, contains SUMF1/FGE domain [Candidatus Electrothrix laxa]
MPDGRQEPSFWETIPGIITAIGTLLGGAAALITALYTVNIIGHDDSGNVSAKSAQESGVRKTAQAAFVSATKNDRSTLRQGDTMTDSTIGMEFVFVPEDCFQMGSSPDEKGRDDDEGPVHEVCVDGFWMGKYEVTQGQWKKIMGDNPAKFQKGDKYPVEQVSWEDVQKFITQLKKRSGKEYRLPTEAEWEYAARAGSSYKYSGGDNLNAVAWYGENSGSSTHSVGQKKANAFGLYDMSGNVWEWCADWYGEKYYASNVKNNPTGLSSGSDRVIRGGGWGDNPGGVRSANRDRSSPVRRYDVLGFRLALPVQ